MTPDFWSGLRAFAVACAGGDVAGGEAMSVPVSQWVWSGHAEHFIGGPRCQFHLATRVGDYIVSTVGEYVPQSGRILGGDRDGIDEDTYRTFETIGVGRLFETFVFRAENPTGFDVAVYEEIDSEPANDHDTATANHMALCLKWAKI